MSDEEKEAIDVIKSLGISIYDGKSQIILADATKEISTAIYTTINLIEKQQKEIEELKVENKEIREWKYVIDNPIDLKKLSELDLIKIFGKKYIAEDKIKAKIEELENMYNKLPKNPREHLHSKTEYKIVIGELQSLLEKE